MTSQGGRPPSTGSVTSVAMASEHRDSTASSLFSFTAVSGKQRPNNGRFTQMDNLYPQLISSKLSLQEIHTGKVRLLPTAHQLQTQSTGDPHRQSSTHTSSASNSAYKRSLQAREDLYPQLINSKLSLQEIHTGKVRPLPTTNQL